MMGRPVREFFSFVPGFGMDIAPLICFRYRIATNSVAGGPGAVKDEYSFFMILLLKFVPGAFPTTVRDERRTRGAL